MKEKEAFLKWTGLDRKSPSVSEFMFAANMRSSIYMSVIIMVLETWMIVRLALRQTAGIDLRSDEYYLSHYFNYSLLLAMGVCTFVYAMRYLSKGVKNRIPGYILKWAFMLICLYFGIDISAADYSKGEQVFTFLTMELFAACFLVWEPWLGTIIISVSYGIFYYVLDRTEVVLTGTTGATPATQINLFIMWIATLFCTYSSYARTISQARRTDELLEVNDHLERLTCTDDLTGIHNMVYFCREADKALKLPYEEREGLTVLFFDIENFRSYNETHGFHEGNKLLKKLSQLITESFQGSPAARFSDDHFVVLTYDSDCFNIVKDLSDEIRKGQTDVQLQLKCGAYTFAPDDRDASLACDRARFACNSIKRQYDRVFRQYDKQLEDKYHLRNHIVNNIDTAIANGYIAVYYQPIMDSSSNEVCGLEALARWNDPEHGMISPGVFIEVLEEHRQVHKLDRCVIEQVCADCRDSINMHGSCIPVSVNLSRLDFELCDIVDFVCNTMQRFELPRETIDIEVTESALTGQSELLHTALNKFHKLGFKIWLDDFGSGYSSLNVLKDFRFDVLKIDMQFLDGFEENENTKPILQNIVSLSKQLDMISLTEGVETDEEYEFLRSIGCGRAQGYLFSKPAPIEKIREMLENGELKRSSGSSTY